MDDEKFKIELLSRLDKIVTLLSISCSMSKAALERSQAPSTKPQVTEAEQAGTASQAGQYQITDEMQESYHLAIQKWKAGKGV
jgi:hypothetical protein